MQQLDGAFQTLRAIKGNGLMVFMCLYLFKMTGMGPVGEKVVQIGTGLSQNTVRNALSALRLMGFVQQVRPQAGWVLSSGAMQLPLVQMLHDGTVVDAKESKNDSVGTTTTTVNQYKLLTGEVEEADAKESKNDSLTEIVSLLHLAEIYSPTAERLARMDHITRDYVIAHASRAETEGIDTALLIHRMMSRDPAPEILPETGHWIKCNCADCVEIRERKKYLRWTNY